MANALGTTSTGLLASRAIELALNSPVLSAFALDAEQFSPNLPAMAKGETLKIKVPALPTVGDFGDAATDMGTAEVSVALSNHKQVYHEVTTAELQALSRVTMNEREALVIDVRARNMAKSLRRKVASDLIALITAANGYTALTEVAIADQDYDYFIDVAATLDADARNCPDEGRWAMVSAELWAVLMKDSRVNKALKGSGADPTETGIIPDVAGFTVIKCPFLATANATTRITSLFGVPSCAAWGSRHPADPSSLFPSAPKNSLNEPMVDALTGLRFLNQEIVDSASLKAAMRVSVLYGVAKAITNHALIGAKTA